MENRPPGEDPGSARTAGPDAEPAAGVRIFRVPRSGRIAAVVLYVLFVVALEFLVLMSFVSKRLWRDDRLFSDAGFTLPLLLWLLLAVVAGVILVRTLTRRIGIGPDRLRIGSVFARTVDVGWDEIGQILAVGRVQRALTGLPGAETLRSQGLQHLIVLDRSGRRLGNVPGNVFSPEAQQALLAAAEGKGLDVRDVPQATARHLLRAHPGSLRWWEAWPGLVAAILVAFYVLHYLTLLLIWGL